MTTGNNNDVKGYADRIGNIMTEQDTLREDLKEIYLEAKEKGVDVKALRSAIAIKRKEKDQPHRQKVNEYLQTMGEPVQYALAV